jgi:colanic acid/amylovoran biosynthesis glycosyltransferase
MPGVVGVVYTERGRIVLDGTPVFSQGVLLRVFRKVWDKCVRRLLRRKWSWETDSAYFRAVRRVRADVILAEYGTAGVEVLRAAQESGVPLVVHFHGFDASRQDILERLALRYHMMCRCAAAVVVVSREMRGQLLRLGCPGDKVIYNPCGVDCDQFGGAEPANSDVRFLAVGRMVEKKAPYLTLMAFARVLSDVPDATLTMIGDEGGLLGVCRDLAVALRIDHAVRFLGEQTHDVVRQEMRQARAFVQHSIRASDGDSEGTPVAILEAGASGLPVIATRHAGIPDVVLDGETGLLVDERDVSGMADCMLRLARDARVAAQLGQQATRRIRARYTMQQSLARLTRILSAAAERRPMRDIRDSIDAELCDNPNDIIGTRDAGDSLYSAAR